MTVPVPGDGPDDAALRACLTRGRIEIDGRVLSASNATFVGEVCHEGLSVRCVYKPVRGERPLWDFASGTLAARELAAYEVSRAAGWDLVPPTVVTDGPLGAGMVQQWVETLDDEDVVDLVPEGAVPKGWLHVLDAWDAAERPVTLVHLDDPALRRMVLFDAVVNNADRKAGHLLATADDLLGCDHGLTFHTDDKLRTVLWGWAGERLEEVDLEPVRRLAAAARRGPLAGRLRRLLTGAEVDRVVTRAARLLRVARFPAPPPGWRSVPWPVF